MSAKAKIRMISAYFQDRRPSRFFSNMFRTPRENFHNTREVEVDIMRNDEDISPVIIPGTGYRLNATDTFTNKKFVPPVHKEAAVLNADDLLDREPGFNPFADQSTQMALAIRAMRAFRKPEELIMRSRELQASQVLQTGTVTLKDGDGNDAYTIDYKPKSSHFPTASPNWGTTSDKLGDLELLCDGIREDGLGDADMAIFGSEAWNLFLDDPKVQARLDNRRMILGGVAPVDRGDGAKFMGTIEVGPCRLEMWTYSGRFKDGAGVKQRYMDPKKVIVRDSTGRLDATFGSIPRIAPPDARVLQFLPVRFSSVEAGVDMFPNGWIDLEGENLTVGVGSRPLYIPTAIDSYGCLDIGT